MRISRRSMLRGVAVGAATTALTSVLPRTLRSAARPQARFTPAEFKAQLRGAVLSIPTPFTSKFAVDYAGIRTMIQRGEPHGIRIVSLTSGNSRYQSLSYEEITKLTETMIDAAKSETLTIASTGDWELPRVVEYARLAESLGADAVQVLKPAVDSDEELLAFFQQVTRSTKLPLVLHGQFTHAQLEQILSITSIVAMKEDIGPKNFIQLQRKFGHRLAIFEGGPEYIYLIGYPYGAPASYTTLGTFVPRITQQFWQALEQQDLAAAYAIVKKYEHPFFDRWSHAFWRASLEHFEVASRYLRPPHTYFTDEQMRDVAAFYNELGLS